MANSIFDTPFISSLKVTWTGTGKTRVFGNTFLKEEVSNNNANEVTLTTTLLAAFRKAYEVDSSALKARCDAGDFTLAIMAQDFTQANVASPVKFKTVTVGAPGVTGCDFNYASAANTTAQNKDLGELIPEMSLVLGVYVQTLVTPTAALTVIGGTASAGNELVSSTALTTAGDVAVSVATTNTKVGTVLPAALHAWLKATPAANWDTIVAGKLQVVIAYVDLGEVI